MKQSHDSMVAIEKVKPNELPKWIQAPSCRIILLTIDVDLMGREGRIDIPSGEVLRNLSDL